MTSAWLIGRTRAAVTLARQHDVDVRYIEGWTSRGRAGFAPRGLVEHCTSDPAVLTTDRMRAILLNGHGSLTGNALCQSWVRRDAVVEVLACGTCWHAGRGVWRGVAGNARLSGVEYHRAQRQQITPQMLDAGAIWTWALTQAFAWPASMVCEHREYAPTRKRDRHGVDGPGWRRRITAGPTPAPAPEPDPTSWLEDLMAAGEKQLADIAAAITRDAEARERQATAADAHAKVASETVAVTRALAATQVANHIARVRDQYGLDPDAHSDGIWGDRVAAGSRTLADAGEALRAAANRTQSA